MFKRPMIRRYMLGMSATVALFLLSLPVCGQKRDEIRDRQGRLIGTILHRSDGAREVRNRQFRLFGTYNPKRNETRDRLGRLLTKGDSLSALLMIGGKADVIRSK